MVDFLGNLFAESETATPSYSKYPNYSDQTTRPPSRRKPNRLAGIINQGATCYLNTLIQTLYFTREFRESIFSLTADELGLVPSANGQIKVRVILMELQRLFGNLMLLDQDACSTNQLTDSFGWTNNEEMQQHDVQELNRILFAAIEKSLINTRNAKFIHELYRGTYVNKIKCLSCQNVFEREEEFFDIPITVQGSDGLRTSLINSFQMREGLNGNNQYKCEKCNNQYRDAEKYCQLKTLPPILTLSLLRFTYDLRTFQRIKETGRFEFPLEIDLNEFMEDSTRLNAEPEESQYELFSVIIHSGNAYGGHYHTYIRDFDCLGKWSKEPRAHYLDEISTKHSRTKIGPQNNPSLFDDLAGQEGSKMPVRESSTTETGAAASDREIKLICLDESDPDFDEETQLVNLDYRAYGTAIELLKAYVYNKHKFGEVEMYQVQSELRQVSHDMPTDYLFGSNRYWLRDAFEIDDEKNTFRLKQCDRISIVSSKNLNDFGGLLSNAKDDELPSYFDLVQEARPSPADIPRLVVDGPPREDKEDALSSPPPAERFPWFDFDDSRVSSITSSEIANQFEGRESAYMLFYRRKNTVTVQSRDGIDAAADEHLSVHRDKVPPWIRHEIETENQRLAQKRDDYDNQVNKFTIDCHLESDFYVDHDVLNMHPQFESRPFTIAVDKRTTSVGQLRELFLSAYTELLAKKGSTPGEVVERREELFLNTLLDMDTTLKWLLCYKLDSSDSSSSSGGDGAPGYFIKTGLFQESENVNGAIALNSHSLGKPFLMITKDESKWPIGDGYLPIRLVVRHFNNDVQLRESSFTFTRNTKMSKIIGAVSEYVMSENHKLIGESALEDENYEMRFSYMHRSYLVQNEKVLISDVYMDKSPEEIWLRNGDYIIVESFIKIDENLLPPSYQIATASPSVVSMRQVKVVNCLSAPFSCEDRSFDSNTQMNIIKSVAALSFSDSAAEKIESCHLRHVNAQTLSENRWLQILVEPSSGDASSAVDSEASQFKGNPALVAGLGAMVHDDITLSHMLDTLGSSVGTYPPRSSGGQQDPGPIVLLLCPGRAPLSHLHEIAIRCTLETLDCALELNASQLMSEVVVDLDGCTIEELTQLLVAKMQLEPLDPNGPQQYILKTTNWLGDSENVLNSVGISCREAKLKHNQLLMLGKGKLIPPNHIKIRIWIEMSGNGGAASLETDISSIRIDEATTTTTTPEPIVDSDRDQVALNDFIEEKYKQFRKLEELVIKYDTKLADLKETVLGVVNKHRTDGSVVEAVRLRMLRKVFATTSTEAAASAVGSRFTAKRALIDWHKPLRQLHMLPETDLCAQIISEDEESAVNQGVVILTCVQMSLKSRKIFKSTYKEIFWNINNGATLTTLKESILKAYPDALKPADLYDMHVAKRQVEKFQWILLKEQQTSASEDAKTGGVGGGANSKVKRQKSQNQQAKTNLRHAPFNLDDGDLIAFTTESAGEGQKIDAQAFMSEEDLSFYQKKEMSSLEIARIRRDKKKGSDLGATTGPSKHSVRPEIGIKIEIDDY